jgi:glycerophosphoryl diester phosphodiesterase
MTLCSYLSREHPLRLAHRGSRVLWPENTIAAFQGAKDRGCLYIETDLHVSKDGVVVVFHDHRLERVTNGKGPIAKWLWEDLRRLDAAYFFKPEEDYPLRGKGIGIPSLEEVIKTFPRMHFNVDLKQPGSEAAVAGFIDTHNIHDRLLIASFSDRRIRRCSNHLNRPTATSVGRWEFLRLWTSSRRGKPLKTTAAVLQMPVRHGGITWLDRKLIQAAHAQGIQVHVWTVNDAQEMRRLLSLDVDGIITDRIDLLNEVLGVG